MHIANRTRLHTVLLVASMLAAVALAQVVVSVGVPPLPKASTAGSMAGRPPGAQFNPPQPPPGP